MFCREGSHSERSERGNPTGKKMVCTDRIMDWLPRDVNRSMIPSKAEGAFDVSVGRGSIDEAWSLSVSVSRNSLVNTP